MGAFRKYPPWGSHPRPSEQFWQGIAGVPALALELFSFKLTGAQGRNCPKWSMRPLARPGRAPDFTLLAQVFAHFRIFGSQSKSFTPKRDITHIRQHLKSQKCPQMAGTYGTLPYWDPGSELKLSFLKSYRKLLKRGSNLRLFLCMFC